MSELAERWMHRLSPPSKVQGSNRPDSIDVWVYLGASWLRLLPYLRAWSVSFDDVGLARMDAGLTLVGAPTLEFQLDADLRKIEIHARRMGLAMPAVTEADGGVWADFASRYLAATASERV